MDKLRKQEENFKLFEDFIENLSPTDIKNFIVGFFKKYKYLLDEDITRVTDSDILKVLPKKTIGIVALNIHDLIEWRIKSKLNIIGQQPAKKFKVGNTTYIGITKPYHVIGWNFNEVVQTTNAYENKHYHDIMLTIIPCIIKK